MQDLRQQQDEAYELSLRADQEKERLKQMERDRILQQQLEEEAERMEQQRQKEASAIRNAYVNSVELTFTIIPILISKSIGYCKAEN